MADEGQADARGLGALLKELADGSGELVRQEARLARLEAVALARGIGTGAASVAIGGVLALVGSFALLAGLILLAADQWLRDEYWLAALIATVVAGGIAALLAWRGLHRLSPTQLAPTQTAETLKEDVEWLKRQRT